MTINDVGTLELVHSLIVNLYPHQMAENFTSPLKMLYAANVVAWLVISMDACVSGCHQLVHHFYDTRTTSQQIKQTASNLRALRLLSVEPSMDNRFSLIF